MGGLGVMGWNRDRGLRGRRSMNQAYQITNDDQRPDPASEIPSGPSRAESLLAIFFIIVITAAVYFPVVDQQFAGWDDIKFINMVWKPGWQRAWAIVSDVKLTHKTESVL